MIKKVRTAHGVSEYMLENGLRVLHREDTTVPLIAVCTTFHVGSRNESKGHTGATHILEHLLFKDSVNFNEANGKPMSEYLQWFGASWNASTWVDRTNYHELLSKEHAEVALAVEADHFRNSLFSASDLASEMTVVRNEYERSRNDPFQVLQEKISETAYEKHPYRIPTIGSKEDIEAATAETLRTFYDTYYWPENATLMVVGDISWVTLKPLILQYFAPIPRPPHKIPVFNIKEPRQTAPRHCEEEASFGLTAAMLAYKIPAATHDDIPALLLADAILGQGYSSRLRRALIDPGLVADLQVISLLLHDPGVLFIETQVSDASTPAKVLEIIRREIALLGKVEVEKSELLRAKEGLIAQFSTTLDGPYSEVRTVSESIAAGDWQLAYGMTAKIHRVSSKDIMRVSKKYLNRTQETSGILHNKE